MKKSPFDLDNIDIGWCPGCGDFGILNMLKHSLTEIGVTPQNLVIVSGIGQAGKTPQYMLTNYFNGLHGRTLPAAMGVKLTNPALTVIAEGGDGDMYGEGGNHLTHAMRRNSDITCLVHNNMVYGLTKGQASPTSLKGFVTPVQTEGVVTEPFNPMAAAIAQDASFVARVNVGDPLHATKIITEAIKHKGFSLVDIFQVCPTFNKVNDYDWFKENTYNLDESHDIHDRTEAFKKATEPNKLALGIFYKKVKPTYEDMLHVTSFEKPLYKMRLDRKKLNRFIDGKIIR